ncbi:hypothetical protein Cgig2_021607 [Carnegiea gigantea]|uniref:Uncharacterized protein n=1 Tax=Carnegiea gigantea TaxID=171969 RepID=A0A9Q1GKZ9_9CARY|nr:hypothetical protein Cgig2_021607 [Carnegiea gigantea]
MWSAPVERRSAGLGNQLTLGQSAISNGHLAIKPPFMLVVQTSLSKRHSKMGFPRLLKTDEMALYALENFEWYYRKVAFPPLPLPSNYEGLCLDFDLATIKEATRNFWLLEISQVIFLVMLLNDAVMVGILRGWLIDIMESIFKELRWSIFQVWVGRNRNHILQARHPATDSNQEEEENLGSGKWQRVPLPSDEKSRRYSDHPFVEPEGPRLIGGWVLASGPWALALDQRPSAGNPSGLKGIMTVLAPCGEADTKEMADHVRETFKWHLRTASHPPRPLLKDYRDLCLGLTLSDAEEVACDFDIPEIVQATFYVMVVNEAMELFVVSKDMAGALKSTLKGLRWIAFES